MFKDIYSAHPSFQPKFVELPYPEELASQLDNIYQCVSSSSSRLTKRTLSELEAQSFQLLASVFRLWQECAQSSLHRDFLQDLHSEAAFLVKEDFKKIFLVASSRVRYSVPIHEVNKLASLCNHGYLFDSLSKEQVLALQQLASGTVEILRDNERAQLLTRADLSRNSGHYVKSLANKLNQYFESNGINKLMSIYLGYGVEIGGLAVEMGSEKSTWWQSTYENSPDTLYIHRDETLALPKAFIYLSYIDENDGPFSVFPDADTFHGTPTWLQNLIGRRIGVIGRSKDHLSYGKFSHIYHQAFGDPVFRSLFRSLPAEARYSSHYGWDLLRGDPVHNQLLSNEFPLHGVAGSFLIFDGSRVSHRALQRATNNHISLQAIFVPLHAGLKKHFTSLRSKFMMIFNK
jgi:hypothetical protein